MDFGEKLSPTAAISSILSSYPFSVGLLRELLQNSDDAKASKQIFVLDLRTHPTDTLYHRELADTQGPALLACNDALFSEMDWEAVQTIYQSSKITDTSKIGKYGVGFRSCYHVTDNPQILSGSTLAIFDPHRAFTPSGGAMFDFVEQRNKHADQLSGFNFFISMANHSVPFPKTIIRLPLRTTAGAARSLIKRNSVEPSKIRQLFDDFIKEEIDIVLLFLTHISSIEIYEVDDQGITCLASIELVKSPSDSQDANITTYRSNVKVTTDILGCVSQSWRVLCASYPASDAATILSERLGYDVDPTLKRQKLVPNIAIAMPLPLPSLSSTPNGRLYTYLPLPLSTGFRCHIHGLFALTPDRQHLRNGEETGVVKGDDSVIVEWNRLLFDTFIPSAWAMLLPILLNQDNLTSIFDAWPLSRPAVQGGDTMYWNDLPCKVVSAIVRYKLAVWPIIIAGRSGQTTPMFSDLVSLIVASKTDSQETLTALAMAEVNITQPPAYVKDLLVEAGVDFVPLTPVTARRALLENEFHVSEPAKINLILSYLLSEGDLKNIIGLPLVRTLNGMHIVLTSNDDAPAHILLTEPDVTVFGDCDGHAIDVTQLPSDAEELFLRNGPAVLNVNSLTNEQVIEYLVTFLNQFHLSLESPPIVDVPNVVIDWLALFWKWHATWRDRLKLFPSIHLFYLVPTSKCALIPPIHGVFDLSPELGTTILEALEAVGILFLHPNITPGARLLLAEWDIIKSATNGHDILDHIPDDRAYNINANATRTFRGHLLSSLTNSRRLGPLNVGQQRKLRCLPIYPIFVPPLSKTNNNNAIREIKPIADDQVIKSVAGISLIPVIDHTVFLDGCRKLLEYLQDDGELLDANGVLSIAVDHLAQQPKHLQRAFIEQIVRDRDNVSPGLLRRLSATSFVAVYGNDISARAPKDVFDPECAVSTLLLNDNRLPCFSDDDDRAIVAALRSLRLLRNTLTNNLIEERIVHISKYSWAQESINLSMRLICLIVDSNHDCSGLYIDPNLKWLPTNAGLLGSRDCHHSDAHPSDLFDEILPMLTIDKMSTSLVEALGWRKSLPLGVVKGQLEKVLQRGQGYQKLQHIIRELSMRVNLSSQDVDDLRALTSDHPWIPISQRCIISTPHAVLSSDVDIPPGFYMVPFSLSDDRRICQFLQLMGCSERPSSNALLRELDNLTYRVSASDTVKISLRLLEALVDTAMSDEERSRLLVPNANCHLRPIACVYYNDLGPRACFVSLPDFVSVAHQSLPPELAKGLGMTFIGHSGLKSLLIDDHDMGEALTSRIRNVLVQYTVEQAFTEFLANAADAKATTFGILLDDQLFAGSHLLSPELAEIQSRPSLVIYNDAVFDDKDFNGIRNVGVGGKVGKSNDIGQFGLGALSMYHFTEVAMIVSGNRVMFLDPSKSYLPFAGRASASMTLSDIRRLYPDHLAPLYGLYGFSLETNYYPGSLFRLPLRNDKSLLSPHSFTMHDLERLVNGHYLNIAPQTLLFTQIDTIKAEHRDTQGRQSQYWLIQGSRSQIYRDGCYESQTLCISAPQGTTGDGQWQIISSEESTLPSQFHPLVDKHRLRNPVRIGLAANLTSPNPHCNFFATMPLPIGSNLPVQLNAPFILSPDRRSIRLDGKERKYNLWLLSQLAPPLYLRLLEELFGGQDWTDPTWWRWWPNLSADVVSSAVVNSLYSQYVAKTNRRICVSVVNSAISPSEAVFLIETDSAEAKLLLYLRPPNLVKPPSYIRRALSKQISTVDKGFVKKVILQNVDRVKAAFVEGQFTVRGIKSVVRFLLKDSQNGENVINLPLLPLANGTLATFGRSSETTCYYTIPGSTSLSVFPPNRFVDHRFSITIDEGLNVSRFNASAAQDLIKDRIPVMPQRDDTGAEDRHWIDSFWSEFQRMDLELESISMFPLIPTATQDSYISLQKCDTDDVIAMGNSASELILAPILTRLGATIVWKAQQHDSLRTVFYDSRFNIDSVLRFFKTIKYSVPNRFARLSGSEHGQFARWGRQHIMDSSKDLVPVARSLPIWTALGLGMEGRFFAASGITMMPAAIYGHLADVLPFLQLGHRFVEYSSTLHHKFEVKLLSFTQFRDRLNSSQRTILDADDMAPYRNLLRIIIANHSHDRRDILIPNSNRVLDYSSNLYARSLSLFRETFQTPRYLDRLVHPDFLELENGLGQFHLRTQMDFASFKECVKVIHDDIYGDRRVERATLLYHWYCTQLPLRLVDSSPHSWRELDAFRFIPPIARERSAAYNQSLYVCRPIPDLELVSPREVLRSEHEAIAWTQRASFTPSGRLLLVDLSLGVPDPVEVLEHLRVLSLQIAPSYPSNVELLSDIKQTYQWLEMHKEDANLKDRLIQYHTEPLFLNVDYPEHMKWTWHSASKLYINISDAPASDSWGVRQFLIPFRGLLRLAGVKEVQMRTAPDMPISSMEQQLNQLMLTRSIYDSMRRAKKLTDVIFITDDGEEFPAHRVVLAGEGEHFRDLFLGSWGESNLIVDRPIPVPECPADCLRWILEYLYTGVMTDIDEQDMLLHILRLAHRWELPSLTEVMQIKLVKYISLDTYDMLREEAEELDADGILANNCNMFEKDNQDAIKKFKGH